MLGRLEVKRRLTKNVEKMPKIGDFGAWSLWTPPPVSQYEKISHPPRRRREWKALNSAVLSYIWKWPPGKGAGKIPLYFSRVIHNTMLRRFPVRWPFYCGKNIFKKMKDCFPNWTFFWITGLVWSHQPGVRPARKSIPRQSAIPTAQKRSLGTRFPASPASPALVGHGKAVPDYRTEQKRRDTQGSKSSSVVIDLVRPARRSNGCLSWPCQGFGIQIFGSCSRLEGPLSPRSEWRTRKMHSNNAPLITFLKILFLRTISWGLQLVKK